MFTGDQLRVIVETHINQEQKLGERVGGSGHLSHISYKIDNISEPQKIKSQVWEITYTYTTFVETEFTYYPDNPPYEYKHKRIIYVNENGIILGKP